MRPTVGFRGPSHPGPTARIAPRATLTGICYPHLRGTHRKSHRLGASAAGKLGTPCGIRADGDSAATGRFLPLGLPLGGRVSAGEVARVAAGPLDLGGVD